MNLGISAYLQTIHSVVTIFTQEVDPSLNGLLLGFCNLYCLLTVCWLWGLVELVWFSSKHANQQSSSPYTKVNKLSNVFFLSFFVVFLKELKNTPTKKQTKIGGKKESERDSVGLPVPVHSHRCEIFTERRSCLMG